MSWDWKTARGNRVTAAESAADQQTAPRGAHAACAPAGSSADMAWSPVKTNSAGGARADAPARGAVIHGSNFKCAFCRGEGDKPAGTVCPVCRGSGLVSFQPPVVTCGYCNGRGEVPPRSGLTCLVCRGKGKVSVKEPVQVCPSCRGRGRKIGAALYCGACRGVGVVSVKGGEGHTGRASVLPSEREALEAVAEAGGCSGKTAVGRKMRLSSCYADQLCKRLAGKGLLAPRDVGIYALTDAGKAAVNKGSAAPTMERQDV